MQPITYINSTSRGGDLWIQASDLTPEQTREILALESYGVSPRRMTLRGWLELTRYTRTQTAPAHLDRDADGISVPCFFRPVVGNMLALDD